ncbi:MAG TPA: bifunctional DNA-formamidopyrimidine glycosylase/DNA-(apurinic or apyrimidinic site) lyase [Myxococcaceae bacterium]|nr:bifunctional DNA-formamidopyrimidine glycosylase/DNA-(apurinic or apyrimidinic site) lyase [Myxococcaceae bacterium]
MPELPEVEIARRNLERWFEGRKVVGAEADRSSRVFRGARPEEFEALRGRLLKTARKGKYLLLTFEKDRGLLAHLGMTGKFVRRPQGHVEPYSRARFLLDNGEVIHYRDPRLFGRMAPTPAGELWDLPTVKELGIDPLADGLTAAQLKEHVGPSKQPVKVALMDQGRVAGLGNIHAAEALFRAGVHPVRKPADLTAADWTRLHKGIHAALDFAIQRETSEEIEYVEEPGSKKPFFVYGRAGEPCRKCKTEIESIAQAGRTTFFCPQCQPEGGRR